MGVNKARCYIVVQLEYHNVGCHNVVRYRLPTDYRLPTIDILHCGTRKAGKNIGHEFPGHALLLKIIYILNDLIFSSSKIKIHSDCLELHEAK